MFYKYQKIVLYTMVSLFSVAFFSTKGHTYIEPPCYEVFDEYCQPIYSHSTIHQTYRADPVINTIKIGETTKKLRNVALISGTASLYYLKELAYKPKEFRRVFPVVLFPLISYMVLDYSNDIDQEAYSKMK